MTQDQIKSYSALPDVVVLVAGSVAADLQAAASRTFDNTVAQVKSQANEAKETVGREVGATAAALRRARKKCATARRRNAPLGWRGGGWRIAAQSDRRRQAWCRT